VPFFPQATGQRFEAPHIARAVVGRVVGNHHVEVILEAQGIGHMHGLAGEVVGARFIGLRCEAHHGVAPQPGLRWGNAGDQHVKPQVKLLTIDQIGVVDVALDQPAMGARHVGKVVGHGDSLTAEPHRRFDDPRAAVATMGSLQTGEAIEHGEAFRLPGQAVSHGRQRRLVIEARPAVMVIAVEEFSQAHGHPVVGRQIGQARSPAVGGPCRPSSRSTPMRT